jgi:gamma-glutamyltranspeptidase / glutathione hydrolase
MSHPPTAPPVTPGVVAGGHPATIDAAVRALRAGGNAYDAAVAAGFAASVAEPCLSSLGGGGFLLARTAQHQEMLFDFFVDTPGRGRHPDAPVPVLQPATLRFGGASQVFHVGHGSIAVPGCLAGYLHVHRRLGRLSLPEVIEPARQMAAEGVVLGADQASVVRLLEPIFRRTADARAMFVPEGRDFADDEVVANPPLAVFLEAIAAGEVTGFGDPVVASAIVQDMAANDGCVTAEDLAAYEVVERTPLEVRHDGARSLTNPAPSFGGALIARALAILTTEGPQGPFGSGPRLRQLVDALDEVTRHHTGNGPKSSRGTTHVSVADDEGNLASMTTSNGAGSAVTLGDTGVLANNIMGETDLHPNGFHLEPAGRRVGSMMAPTILLRDGAAPIVLGSGGSERIRSALTQTVANLLDHGMSLEEAVLAPRLHWDGSSVQLEPGFAPEAVAALGEVRDVNVWEVTDLYFGGVNAVAGDGARIGDPRRGGCTDRVER